MFFMGDELRSLYLNILGILIALLTFLLSLEFSVVVKVLASPYFLLVVVFVVLWFLILGVKESVVRIGGESQKSIIKSEDGVVIAIKNYREELEERFKIYDRLNRLELEVFDGKKKRSA